MDIVLLIAGILILGFLVNVLLKQSYNFIFFLGKKPVLWIVSVFVIAVVVWGISSALGWRVSVPAWACTLAFFMNIAQRYDSADEKKAVQAMADEVYAEMGLKHGRLLRRIGLTAFVLACLGSWVVFYGEVCSGDECTSIIESFF